MLDSIEANLITNHEDLELMTWLGQLEMYEANQYLHDLSRSAPGCVTRHTRHASVTHFRPISGNIVEVPLVTPPIMYINSHTKETYFP